MTQARTLWGAAALATLIGISTVAIAADSIQLRRWELKNGLRVIFVPHHRVPVATVQLWYHVGSKDEHIGIRGVAHMFEHMMFKGSLRVAPEAHARLLAAVGGYSNAFTTQDVTAYHDTVPKQYVDFALELEADRMRNLRIREGTMKSERDVVKEEKRLRVDNSPVGRALEAMHELAFKKHPYAWTAAGRIEDLNKTNRQTYQDFYDLHYLPNNAVLVVVGDLKEADVRAKVARYFDGIPRGKDPKRVSIVEPTQTAPRNLRGDWPSQLNIVLGAYHTPPARHADIAPLKVLSAILSAGRSSRLHQALVRKQKVALAAGGFVHELEHPGLFFIYAVGLPRHSLDKAKAALLAETKRLAETPVRPEELRKAKNQLASAHVRALATVGGIAGQIGESALVQGDPTAFLREAAALDRVTAADIQRVAKRYLRRDRLNLLLVPAGSGKAPKKGGASQKKGETATKGEAAAQLKTSRHLFAAVDPAYLCSSHDPRAFSPDVAPLRQTPSHRPGCSRNHGRCRSAVACHQQPPFSLRVSDSAYFAMLGPGSDTAVLGGAR